MMASMVANGNRDGQPLVLKGVDPETCMIVFKNHWTQVVKILEKHDPLRSGGGLPLLASISLSVGGGGGGGIRFGPVPSVDEASAVQNYVEHMLFLLMEEDSGREGAMGPILEFVVMENVMERLFVWSLRREFSDDMKLEQLKMYEALVGQARQPVLHHKPVLRPLMMLLSACADAEAPGVEGQLVLLLHQLCCVLAKDPSVLELFFHTSEDQGAANFLIFSLLIPFLHREGGVGQQARDALLLIMALSAENQRVAEHIAQNTYFCPVLATGLSGLYSSLPTKLEVPNEEWHCLHGDDWARMPPLVQFLNSLEFCNAVVQVAHADIRDQLLGYIYNGFLVPVLAPALHKLTLEEVMTTTAYLELFIRSVSEPALLQTLLTFILLHRHDNVHILDTLVSRINTPYQLGTVSLALFRTLIGLYCEDVMLQLILRYLIPCNHMMLSQRCVVRERDCYSVSAAKMLALTPSCCTPEHAPPPLRQLDSIVWTRGHAAGPGNHGGATERARGSQSDDGSSDVCVIGSEVHLDVSYLHYLYDARLGISECMRACQVWSAPYDGRDPPVEDYPPPGEARLGPAAPPLHPPPPPPPSTSASSSSSSTQHRHPTLAPPPEPASTNQQELEWDDSYDACPAQGAGGAEPEGGQALPRPPAAEPPQHIQEMRRTAIMLVRGSYVEESDFQDDVMVYDLVAKRTTADAAGGGGDPAALRSPPGDSALPSDATESAGDGPSRADSSAPASAPPSPGERDCAATPESPRVDDLLTQYQELIGTLSAEVGVGSGGGEPAACPAPTLEEGEEEEMEGMEVDYSSFSADTPEPEKSPLGAKHPRPGGRGHAVPFTGPFVSVLLSRLENMLENSVHVNLLLTGILAQLAAYPQPLLRSFLLNTNMVFQPSVRSLYQVLASVKNQIEDLTESRKDFPGMITAAQHWLLARESSLGAADSAKGGAGAIVSEGSKVNASPQPKGVVSLANTEVFAAVLFTEFLKELAAIAQEHSILSYIPMEE
ncbi:FHF complex subunit HOOK-interacting protein 1A [Gadus chalcogrammus]|uniref:FHF complex subunit HOOK-interacting protein 1A n=1 Tax=Gadus chalcogrammus TaxID=1042646 RepID=UPI0024C2B719|nr:FHF complex subunit HOOK-interacting protein 1A [Gadus chalcogrammus]